MQIAVIERSQNIQVQEQEITRRDRELDATIRKPAEAEKYRLEKLAEANKLVTHRRVLLAQPGSRFHLNQVPKVCIRIEWIKETKVRNMKKKS